MSLPSEETLARRIKTPANESIPLEFWTGGVKRMELAGDGTGLTFRPSSSSPSAPPAAGQGTFFFRTDGGKAQFCVRFPSGPVQILATEP